MLHSAGLTSRGHASLPTHRSRDSLLAYSKTAKGKRAAAAARSHPYWLLLLLCLGLCGAVPPRSTLEEQEPTAPHLGTTQRPVKGQEWAKRHVSQASGEELAQAQAGTHEEAPSPPPFNEALHKMYLELPPLGPVPRSIYAGGWQLTQPIYDYAANQPMAEVISWENPRAVLFRSFLSPQEADHFVNVSAAKLVRSEVLSAEDDEAVDDARTSYGSWSDKDEVVRRVQERIHRLVSIPERFGEDIYVLNYKKGQKYEAHTDQCFDGWGHKTIADDACVSFLKRAGGPECGPGKGGPTCGDRVATFILTLRSATKGGATVFPEADATKAAVADHPSDHTWYCEHPGVLGVKPGPGDAILFWDYAPSDGAGTGSYADGTADPSARTVYAALHSGCPVLEGEKWIATRWIRGAGFDYRGEDLE